jgi:cofilin
MQSGIKPSSEDITLYEQLSKNRTLRCLVYEIKNDKLNVVFQGDNTFEHDQLADYLPNDKCRIVILDFFYETDDKRKVDKIIMITWCPQGASSMEKFRVGSSSMGVSSGFGNSIAKIIQADNLSEVSYDNLRKNIK